MQVFVEPNSRCQSVTSASFYSLTVLSRSCHAVESPVTCAEAESLKTSDNDSSNNIMLAQILYVVMTNALPSPHLFIYDSKASVVNKSTNISLCSPPHVHLFN
ncbi:hypothetical protein AMECASPLE_004036 [Ameca splendens]|uniref:Uncharacterized protein n=1 Tax=Ameca splendens TaxID=208324 RepID=A0ABV0ZJF4_9TELE